MLLGRLRRPGIPPRGLRLGFRFVRSPRLLLLELFASFQVQAVAALAALLFCSSCACLVSSGTAASRMLTVVLALGGLSGCSPLGVLPPRFPPCCLLPFWVVSAAAWELAFHFSLTFSGGVVVAPWFLVGVLQRFSPPGGFLLQFLEGVLPPLWRWRDWMAESSRPIRSSGRLPGACSKLSSSPLALHGVVSTSPVCLSWAPAFRQVRIAMLAEGSVESPSVLVLAFHSSLFLVEGSSDGSAPGDRSSPLDGCVYSLRFRLRSVASALSLLGSWAFLPPLSVSLLSGMVAPFLEETVRSSRRFLRLPVLSMVGFCLT